MVSFPLFILLIFVPFPRSSLLFFSPKWLSIFKNKWPWECQPQGRIRLTRDSPNCSSSEKYWFIPLRSAMAVWVTRIQLILISEIDGFIRSLSSLWLLLSSLPSSLCYREEADVNDLWSLISTSINSVSDEKGLHLVYLLYEAWITELQ